MPRIPAVFDNWIVLLVDDEQDSLEVAQMLLQMAGAKVLTATNGVEALSILKTTKPKFILSDISMPEMNGWQMMDLISRDRFLRDIPVIALTAFAMPGDRDKAIEAGFANHITKPLEPSKFIGQLVNLLAEMPEVSSL
jgi:two-component system, cell cycle response regulator DivK